VQEWRQGRVEDLECVTEASLGKVSEAVRLLRGWATRRGLTPSETAYVARTRDRRPLQFSRSGDPDLERAYRTHWVAPELSEVQRRRLSGSAGPPDLVVVWPLKDFTCTQCSGSGQLLIMEGPGPLCLSCADMDHLVYLPSGDAALTRRAKKASGLSAVVVRFSRSRRRYERQGVLVEPAALEQAETVCLADEEARGRRRARDEARRAEQDVRFQQELAGGIPRLFPGCPPGGYRRSPRTRPPEAAAGSAAARPAARSTRRRSPWRWPPPCATRTPGTTPCSCPGCRGQRPAISSVARCGRSSTAGGRRLTGDR